MSERTIVLVTGGREFGNRDALWDALDHIHVETPISLMLSGHCPIGADAIAEDWAEEHGVLCVPLAAPWEEVRLLCGRAEPAGPLRNSILVRALVTMRANRKLVLSTPGGRGTADCVRRARAAGLVVVGLDGKAVK